MKFSLFGHEEWLVICEIFLKWGRGNDEENKMFHNFVSCKLFKEASKLKPLTCIVEFS